MKQKPQNQADMLASDQDAMRRLDSLLLKQGQYLLPGVRRFVSTVNNAQDLEDSIRALDQACRIFKRG